MQDEDGGVWHKQTSERFPGFVMPEKDKLVSYVVGSGAEPFKTSCATGDLAAVMAIAARAYKPFDAAFAAQSLRAAEKAWTWLGKYPECDVPQSAGGIDGRVRRRQLRGRSALGGGGIVADHGRRRVSEVLPGALRGVSAGPYGRRGRNRGRTWPTSGCGPTSWAAARTRRPRPRSARRRWRRRTRLSSAPGRTGTGTSLTSRDYIWGSNAVAANYGMQLLVANAFERKPALRGDRAG